MVQRDTSKYKITEDPIRLQRGLSLIELILTMALIGIISLFISGLITYEVDMYTSLTGERDRIQRARRTLQILARDLRHVAAADSIVYADTDSLSFDDVDDTTISFGFANGSLRKNGYLLQDGLQSIQFQYFDDSGNALGVPVSTPANIGSITIAITTLSNGRSVSFSTKVQPRNF